MKFRLTLLILTVFAVPVLAHSVVAAVKSTAQSDDSIPITVKDASFEADYFPSADKNKYGVIVLTGSAGGKTNGYAQEIAKLGYSVLSLAYFKDGPLVPESLEMIPLEYFEAPKKWLMNREETRNDGVIVAGLSKGAELALVLASHDNQYKGVIGIAPSSVVWSGIPNVRGLNDYSKAPSSWSKDGKPLAFIPYLDRTEFRENGQNGMLDWHKASLVRAKEAEKAVIKVEKIKSPILLLSGGNDRAWPSNQMGKAVCERANTDKNKNLCTHTNYENGSHLLGEAFEAGMKETAKFLNMLHK